MSAEAVLDASAVLALLQGEPGADRVRDRLPGAVMSAVNAAEVVGRLVRAGVPPEAAEATLRYLACPIAPFDEAQAVRTGILAAVTAPHGLSLGDRACIALAEREGVPAVTADRAWAGLPLPAPVELIR